MGTYERHATLTSRGAPKELHFLNGSWQRDKREPVVCDRPHYVRPGAHVYFCGSLGEWRVAAGRGGVPYMSACSSSHHPNTVELSDWRNASGAPSKFEFVCSGPNTQDRPFLLEEIGIDFFVRGKHTALVTWFETPEGAVCHSRSKARVHAVEGPGAQPGKRYCHICQTCLSANNFHSQHLARHRPSAPGSVSCTPDQHGGVYLLWEIPPARDCPELIGFHVRFSTDDGASWQVAIENTKSFYPFARVTGLAPGRVHIFAVAGVNEAGTGRFSPASPPLLLDAPEFSLPAAPRADVTDLFVRTLAEAVGGECHLTRTLQTLFDGCETV